MNKQLHKKISQFIDNVAAYIELEYDSYSEEFSKKKSLLFDFIGSYYMGGNNVPDTARYVVELIKNNYYEPKN